MFIFKEIIFAHILGNNFGDILLRRPAEFKRVSTLAMLFRRFTVRFSRTSHPWTSLSMFSFPAAYNLHQLKYNVYHYLLSYSNVFFYCHYPSLKSYFFSIITEPCILEALLPCDD